MTQETIRGLIMVLWALTIARHPHLHGLPLYDGLARLVSWLGNPSDVWAIAGGVIGTAKILAAEIGERTGAAWASWFRRAAAIASIAYWLLAAAGFAETSPTLPAVVAYAGLAALDLRTALGLRPR